LVGLTPGLISINIFILGMINNYQRDAGQEDDRDSGSLSLITPLDEGDQVNDYGSVFQPFLVRGTP
jgi:hypothetical protein